MTEGGYVVSVARGKLVVTQSYIGRPDLLRIPTFLIVRHPLYNRSLPGDASCVSLRFVYEVIKGADEPFLTLTLPFGQLQ